MKSYSSITGKYLREHKKRTILTVFGIVVAIAMFTCVGLVYYSLLNGQIERVKKESGDFEVAFVKLSAKKLEILKNNAEVASGAVINELGKLEITSTKLTDAKRSLNVEAYDHEALTKVFKPEIVYGRMPENNHEVIVDIRFWNILKDKNAEKRVTGTMQNKAMIMNKEYTVVGAYSAMDFITDKCYPAITYLEEKDNQLSGEGYDYFVNLKDKKHKAQVGEQIAKATGTELVLNKELLYFYRQGPDAQTNDALRNMIIVVILIIALSTIVVIYNIFNTSIMERIKHFGILRALGATKDQIRNLVLKEALIMSAAAIPIGVFIGHLGLFVTFKIIDGFSEWFKFGLYPQVILLGSVLGLVTVMLSVLAPSISASRVAPIEAIRGNGVIKKEKVKRRSGLLAKLVFSFEGQVAYKNMRRNGKRFWLTTVSLMISLILFVFFNMFINLATQSASMLYKNTEVEGNFSFDPKGPEGEFGEAFINSLEEHQGITQIFANNNFNGPLLIAKDKLNQSFYKQLLDRAKSKTTLYKDMYICSEAQLIAYDENAFDAAKKKNKLNMSYDTLQKDGVILINRAYTYNTDKKHVLGDYTTYKVGDEIKIPKMSEAYYKTKDIKYAKEAVEKKEFITLKVAGIIEKEVLMDENPNTFGMIISNDNFHRITGKKGYNNVSIKYASKKDSEKLYEPLSSLVSENGAKFYDVYQYMSENRKVIIELVTLAYGFIALITLIAIVNIINTITMNLLVKKREFAVFKAIGMTKEQFKKLVLLEGTLYGLFASVFGTISSFVLVHYILQKSMTAITDGIKLPVWPYVAGITGIITITFVAALIPLRKLNDMNIIDGLRVEE